MIPGIVASHHYAAAGDPNWAFKVLGLHCDGANNSTTFTDVKGHAITAGGNAKISTAQYPALTGKTSSALFDGADDYLTTPDSNDWDFGTGDFTVRCRFRCAAHTTVMTLITNYQNSTNGWSLQIRSDNSTITFGNGDPVLSAVSWTPTDNTWYDIEVSRVSGSLRTFVDGTQVGSTVSNSTNITGSTSPLLIGNLYAGGSYVQDFNGHMSEIEIYKGVGLHSANFTPATSPFLDY